MRFRLLTKIVLTSSAVALVVGGAGLFVMFQMDKVVDQYDQQVLHHVGRLDQLRQIDSLIFRESSSLSGYVLMHNPSSLEDYQTAETALTQALAGVMSTTTDSDAAAMLEDLQLAQQDEAKAYERIIRFVDSQQDHLARQILINEVQPLAERSTQLIESLIQRYADAASLGQQQAQEMARMAKLAAISALAAGIVLAFIISRMLARAISRPIVQTAAAAAQVAAGDLRVGTIAVRTRDEVADLVQSFNQMVTTLQTMTASVAETSRQVSAAAESLSASSVQMADASGQAADSVGSLAAGAGAQAEQTDSVNKIMHQLDAAIGQVAAGATRTVRDVQDAMETLTRMVSEMEALRSNAGELARGGQQAAEISRAGAGAVTRTVAGMARIKEATDASAARIEELSQQSRQIGEIIAVMSSIAGQTNMLALNAAIEAARAGEHGRGFAVVAEEVRKLAEMSARSATQVDELIRGIQAGTAEAVRSMEAGSSEVNAGQGLAEEAGRALAEITQVAERIAGGVSEIARAAEQVEEASRSVASTFDAIAAATEENTAATEQMAAGAAQVSAALAEIASIARENAAVAEEVSASAEELTSAADSVAGSAADLREIAAGLLAETSRFKA